MDEQELKELMRLLENEIPFYHLKNLPNREATELTRETICETSLSGRRPKI